MRRGEEAATEALLGVLTWHALDETIAQLAGEIGREFLSAQSGIDSTDLAIGATATALDAQLLTRNVEHVPMIAGPSSPY